MSMIVLPGRAGSNITAENKLHSPVIESGLEWKPGDPMAVAGGALLFDLQERLRFEYRDNNFDFNDYVDSITDDNYLLQRLKIGMKIKPSDDWAVYVQGQDSREYFSDRPSYPGFNGAEGDSYIGLKQGYFEYWNFKNCPFGFKLGRQELNYGDQRLVGAFDWNNIGRVFDGLRMHFEQEKWNIEGFAVLPVNMRIGDWNEPETQDRFFGVYYTAKYLESQQTDVYAFFRNKTDANAGFPTGGYTRETPLSPNSVPGSQAGNYVTIGTRGKSTKGKLGPWDYSYEANLQVGTIVNNAAGTSVPNATTRRRDLLAYAGYMQGGYTFTHPMNPRIALGYDFASGDESFTSGTGNSFQNLFPTNHKFYGYMDLFAWRNLHNPHANFSISPVAKLNLSLDYHAFFLANTNDYWYRANGYTPVRTGANRLVADRFVGQEIDLVAKYSVTKWMKTEIGYSYFLSGSYLSDTGPGNNADFFYTQVEFQF
ncbi:MAG: alginate export family protein [Verrucomicrobiota bacterium]|nr:alginate export family protein [Verrucomicrobiota bacterium]